MIRLQWRSIPKSLLYRKNEILGEIRGNMMVDCVYNACLAGELSNNASLQNIDDFVPSFLKDYQKKDLAVSLTRKAVFNINKPGYGKTLETILWIKVNLIKDFKALILCPKSVIETWYEQLNQYWPGWQQAGFWWITNYQQLYEEQRASLAQEFHWDVIVLDESHKIKSFKSKITRICMKLQGDAKHCLTGTPIKNRPEDLAAQLKWLDPYSITNYTDFQNSFCHIVQDGWGGKPRGLTKNQTMVHNLQNLLDLYCVGGEEQHIGLGEVNHIKVRLQLDPPVKRLYAETTKKTIDTVALLSQGVKISNPVEAITRRQQITTNPQMFNENFRNVKFEWVMDWLEGCDEKVLIFSKFATVIERLYKLVGGSGYGVHKVVGGMSSLARQREINKWHSGGRVLLGTYGALGEGTDGLQDSCNYCIFLDRLWNASDNEQAEGRIARMGQTKNVTFYILQGIATIDIRIELVQHYKDLDISRLLEEVAEEE